MVTRYLLFFVAFSLGLGDLWAYGAATPAPATTPASTEPATTPMFNTPSSASIYAQTLARQELLPTDFPVYTDGKNVVNTATPGFTQKTLPTNNDFVQAPGCYVMCYSHSNSSGVVYPVTPDTYAYGQIRVPGNYEGRICKPTGYENVDISASPAFKTLCATKIRSCQNNACWAGGDTGGWFGIQ